MRIRECYSLRTLACPYNVGVCVDGGRCGFAIMDYNLWSTYDTSSSSILGSDITLLKSTAEYATS